MNFFSQNDKLWQVGTRLRVKWFQFLKTSSAFLCGVFAKNWKKLKVWKKETMMENEFFFKKKNEFIFLKTSLKKWDGAKQTGDSVPASYLAPCSLEFGRQRIWKARVFFREKNEFIFLKRSLRKWEGEKQAGDSVPACYFAAYSSEIGKRSIPPKCVCFLPNVGQLSSRKNDIGPRFWKQFVKIAKMARVAKMAKKPIWPRKVKWLKWSKEPKWPNWPYVYSGQNGLIGQNCHTRQNGQSD